jgi:excisionase family DNA binding protein
MIPLLYLTMKKPVATIKEIAKRLNISVSTVSRALHDHHSIGLRTKMRVKELAKELKYEPNQAAILFKKGKTFTMESYFRNYLNLFFPQPSVALKISPNPKIITSCWASLMMMKKPKNYWWKP